MALEEIFRFRCDAPGCKVTKEFEAPQQSEPEAPEGWYDEQVGDTRLIGCSEVHICAAIVKELGYEDVAVAMMGLRVVKPAAPQPPKPAPEPPRKEAAPATIPMIPRKED
jgi:hypothetical protein